MVLQHDYLLDSFFGKGKQGPSQQAWTLKRIDTISNNSIDEDWS